MARDEQGNELTIVRRISATVVEVVPEYPGGPAIYNEDEETGRLFRISCSDKHNDGIMRALLKMQGIDNG
jgi:hypothetical protein